MMHRMLLNFSGLTNRLFRQFTRKSLSPTPHANRARLCVAALEDRSVPSVVYSNTFDWNGVATVVETVTDDDPSHPGQYHWNFHVTKMCRPAPTWAHLPCPRR